MQHQSQHTSRTSCSCCAIFHSSSFNSNAHSSASRFAVIPSITRQYFNVNFNMSYVEFHRVETSCGMIRVDSLTFSIYSFQSGRSFVVECMSLYASLRSCERQLGIIRYVQLIHLTLTSTNRTGSTLSLSTAHSSASSSSISSTHPSVSSLSLLPAPAPLSAAVTSSSMSTPAAKLKSSFSASFNAESASLQGTSNCFSS